MKYHITIEWGHSHRLSNFDLSILYVYIFIFGREHLANLPIMQGAVNVVPKWFVTCFFLHTCPCCIFGGGFHLGYTKHFHKKSWQIGKQISSLNGYAFPGIRGVRRVVMGSMGGAKFNP